MAAEVSVIRLFEEQAGRWPDRPAVVAQDGSLTYRELDQLSGRIARVLRATNPPGDTPVAVMADRGTLQIAGILATMRVAAPYFCVDLEQPASRQDGQLADSGARVVLTDRPRPAVRGDVVDMTQLPTVTTMPEATDSELAYIVYTSGSSGTPKGVAVTGAGLANYSRYIVDLLDCPASGGAFASVTSLATDLGNTAVFPALISGGCLHLVSTDVARDPVDFAAYMQNHRIDYLKITPSHLSALLDYPDPDVLPRRALVLGGETARWDLVDSVRRLGDCRIINHYGPTETTVGSLTHEVAQVPRSAHRAAASVPIGGPIAATWIHVVDQRIQPVPVGETGELLVSGAGLAQGYWKSPELTAERFIFLDDGSRAYRTGDVVRQLDDGAVEFIGRADGQLKVRGHRVEPGEIETLLCRHPEVSQAVVLPTVDEFNGTSLTGYVVAVPGGRPTPVELLKYLAELLPSHLVPAAITVLKRLPFLASGKVDRAALSQQESLPIVQGMVRT
ncbi:amino acid adenylation domain-containing protein [Streptomyces sp. SID13031]|uniref:amino acid adenylation domain-containing protein n=1 Tax=Streptomyces sp. SID13031 TaxID=2706046 RepID=UPI0013CD7729|nr:amino acid adenylation domain-containing protein [Streptomyces sp. SID13031]NEA32503.1 amino acid adenylation domain-containing protein [Streptomyces sp. SID13031]